MFEEFDKAKEQKSLDNIKDIEHLVPIDFFCRVYKVIETGGRMITLHIQAYDEAHKQDILNHLREIGLHIGPNKSNNLVCRVGMINSDFTYDGKTTGKSKK